MSGVFFQKHRSKDRQEFHAKKANADLLFPDTAALSPVKQPMPTWQFADLIDFSDCSSCSNTEMVSVVISTTVTCAFAEKESNKGTKRNAL
jgi:hypothetical protein